MLALAGKGRWAGNSLSAATISGGNVERDEAMLKLYYCMTASAKFVDLANSNPKANA